MPAGTVRDGGGCAGRGIRFRSAGWPRASSRVTARARSGMSALLLLIGTLCAPLAAFAQEQAAEATIVAARYVGPTDHYPHRVLGPLVEHEALEVTLSDGSRQIATLDRATVFEDIAPRLVDLDRDGRPELVVVESDQSRGARLAVWGLGPEGLARRAATPFIGTRFRWLAVAGAADLDGDGTVEIAYVDRPHLAKVLRVWRFDGGTLAQVAAAEGHTNHRIGDSDIAGGIRDCGGAPEIVTASADWSQVLGTRLVEGALVTRVIGPHAGRRSFAGALRCD